MVHCSAKAYHSSGPETSTLKVHSVSNSIIYHNSRTPGEALWGGAGILRKLRYLTPRRRGAVVRRLVAWTAAAVSGRSFSEQNAQSDYASIQINSPKKSQAANLDPTVQDKLVTQGQSRGTDRVENETMRPIESHASRESRKTLPSRGQFLDRVGKERKCWLGSASVARCCVAASLL
jgi:hypothetical protein